MKNCLPNGRNQQGFTLVEMMVVVVIVGILITIAVPVYNKVTATAEEKACLANIKIIEGAMEVYKAANGTLPGSVGDLMEEKKGGPFLKEKPQCPSKGRYDIDDKNGEVTCDRHSSSGGSSGTN